MVRRIVTGHRDGKSVFINDGTPPRTFIAEKMPGMVTSLVWATSANPQITDNDQADVVTSTTGFVPSPGETRLILLKFPPDSILLDKDFDLLAAATEFADHNPDIAATRERDDPAMHRTDTIDYIIVLDGELHLELDDGVEKVVKAHDLIVQNGTRHAWRNKGDQVATLAVVAVGAKRITAV